MTCKLRKCNWQRSHDLVCLAGWPALLAGKVNRDIHNNKDREKINSGERTLELDEVDCSYHHQNRITLASMDLLHYLIVCTHPWKMTLINMQQDKIEINVRFLQFQHLYKLRHNQTITDLDGQIMVWRCQAQSRMYFQIMYIVIQMRCLPRNKEVALMDLHIFQ